MDKDQGFCLPVSWSSLSHTTHYSIFDSELRAGSRAVSAVEAVAGFAAIRILNGISVLYAGFPLPWYVLAKL